MMKCTVSGTSSIWRVAYEELDDDGNPTGNWKIASRGSSLPDSVYFVKSLSENNAPALNTMTITLPGNSSTSCYFYEFNL